MNRFRSTLAALAAVTLLAVAPAVAQAPGIISIDTTFGSPPVTGIDTTFGAKPIVSIDTTFGPAPVLAIDSTFGPAPIVSIDTTFAPVASGSCPNEPTGWTLLSDRGFVPLASPITRPNGVERDLGWTSAGGGFVLAADPSAPDGDGRILRERYDITNRVGSGTYSSWFTGVPFAGANVLRGKGYRHAYTCFMTRIATDYVGEASQTNKQFWVQWGPSQSNRTFINFASPGLPRGIWPIYPGLSHQGLYDPTTGGTLPSIAPAKNTAYPFHRGAWDRVEFRIDAESAHGASDGVMTVWLNGVMTKRLTGLNFTFPGEVIEITGLKWNNTYGGGSAFCTKAPLPTQAAHPECFVPHLQFIDLDRQRLLVN